MKSKAVPLIFCLALIVSAAHNANALDFVLTSTIDTNPLGIARTAGITIDPNTGNLWVVDDRSANAYEVNPTDGSLVSSFNMRPEGSPDDEVLWYTEGVAFDPLTSTLLITESDTDLGLQGVYAFDTKGNRIDSDDFPFLTQGLSDDPDGIAVDPGTGNIWIADDDNSTLYLFDRNGNKLGDGISTTAISSDFLEPKGVAIDPISGNLFVADEELSTQAIWYVTPSSGTGTKIIDMTEIGGIDADPEGVAYDPGTMTLYVAGGMEGKLWVFEDQDAKLELALLQTASVPEPSILLLIGTSLLVLGVFRRNAQG